jgi:hypothetical protein
MQRLRDLRLAVLVVVGLWAAGAHAELSEAVRAQLAREPFVYIASTRKDGALGRPAEIWFLYHQGAVYVGTSPTSWRVKRIRWGRPRAKIWVGKPDGPSFLALGEIVRDAAVEQVMLETYARKYPERWGRWERSFREGFRDGSRVVVKYTPLDAPESPPTPRAP